MIAFTDASSKKELIIQQAGSGVVTLADGTVVLSRGLSGAAAASARATAVPEPAAISLLGAVLAGLLAVSCRRRSA